MVRLTAESSQPALLYPVLCHRQQVQHAQVEDCDSHSNMHISVRRLDLSSDAQLLSTLILKFGGWDIMLKGVCVCTACEQDRTMPLQMERRNQRRSTASTGSGGRSDRMSYDNAWAAPSAPSSNGCEGSELFW